MCSLGPPSIREYRVIVSTFFSRLSWRADSSPFPRCVGSQTEGARSGRRTNLSRCSRRKYGLIKATGTAIIFPRRGVIRDGKKVEDALFRAISLQLVPPTHCASRKLAKKEDANFPIGVASSVYSFVRPTITAINSAAIDSCARGGVKTRYRGEKLMRGI